MKISNFKLGIGVPLSFPFVPAPFFHSWNFLRKTEDFEYISADNGHIEDLRNNIAQTAILTGCTNLIMMDVDQIYHQDTIPRLLSHRLPMVGALVHRRYPPFDSLMMKRVDILPNVSVYESIDEWEDNKLIEVDATGTGCIMFDVDLFREMDKQAEKEIIAFNKLCPSAGELSLLSESSKKYIQTLQEGYRPKYEPGVYFKTTKDPNGSVKGEDFNFCERAKELGYKIYVDTSVPAGHLTQLIVNTATNRLYRSRKTQQQREAVEQALMGMK